MINVLSLFDGMSCGQIALERAGISVGHYFASEIDKYAIKVTSHNYPNTAHLGDVTKIKGSDLPEIDLIIGGSPCQGFSFAGKQLNFADPRYILFFEYSRLLQEIKPKKFLLENVRMKKESENIISQLLGAEPIKINSSLVSAQNRMRNYWTNIEFTPPINKNLLFRDVRKYKVAENFYYSPKALQWIKRHETRTGKTLRIQDNYGKHQMLEATMYKNYSSQRFYGISDINGLRYTTPLECERLQTVPDNYTAMVSNTQRYKMLGNGWTVDIIAHIFNAMAEQWG